jgi:MFS family permease
MAKKVVLEFTLAYWYAIITARWNDILMNVLYVQQSLFFATEALTTFHWSRLSDLVGRKPILLIGLTGISISMYSFGLSRTFWSIVLRYV